MHTDGVPPETPAYQDSLGQESAGFYILFLELKQYEADPNAFFEILEVDRKIGWTNPEHVEELVFNKKGLKIINDEQVSD